MHCGYVTIIGRSNVGKSTLLNNLVGQKISITSRKPQTTRRHIIGVNTDDNYQIIYIDTPGMQDSPVNAINRYMNKEASSAIAGIDLLIYMIEALKWTALDEHVLKLIKNQTVPIILVVNKIDKVKDKKPILPYLKKLSGKMNFKEIIPISALSRNSLRPLEQCIKDLLPECPFQYPDDQVTDKTQCFFAAEFVREKLIKRLGDELPYSLTVTIDSFVEKEKIIHIDAIIWVATRGQKAIVIGQQGEGLKAVGSQARRDMERMFDCKVFLRTWVKVKDKWMDNERAIKQLGFDS
ncbi:MAG: GTPase Era [Proteobacteria bacterium]|nr:GTPase Era [Pseudomonadota bacterium]MCH8976061.1 GTPase Era [Pseudomonadota bacterium]